MEALSLVVELAQLREPSQSLGTGLKLLLHQLLKLGSVLSICLIIAGDASDLGVYFFRFDFLLQVTRYERSF